MNSLLQKTTTHQKLFFKEYSSLLKQLVSQGQKPIGLFVTCADSRLVPENLLGMKPGQFFMLRNAGNIIPPYSQTDTSIGSTLEFAIIYLQIPYIIICGHTECGAIQSLDTNIDSTQTPALSQWLELARPAQQEIDRHPRVLSPTERHEAIVVQNVQHQLHNLTTYPYIRQQIDAGTLSLHGWLYNLQKQEVATLAF